MEHEQAKPKSVTLRKHQFEAGQTNQLYEPVGMYLLRAPHLPAQVFIQMTTATTVSETSTDNNLEARLASISQQSYDVLARLVECPAIEQALFVASSDIAAGIECIKSGDHTSRRARQAFAGIFRYLVRMCTRPTPFGLFAGVAIGSLGDVTTAQLGISSLARIRTRPDMSWLLSLIQQVEENRETLPQLHVLMNRSIYMAGARAVLPSADIYGKGDNRSVAVRATRVFQYIQEIAREPIPYSVLQQKVCKAFPQATEQQVEKLLQQLWESHFLISDLRPPLTSPHPEQSLLKRLRQLPGAQPLTAALDEILHLMAEIDSLGAGGPTHLLGQLVEKQQKLVPAQKEQTYQIDAGLALEQFQLNVEVGRAVADATEVLLRLERSYSRQHLREYYGLFIERYGMHAEVPVLDLLSPEFGLDAPSTYLEPPRTFRLAGSPPLHTEQQEQRDRLLSSLLATALHEQAKGIEVTDTLLEQLAQWQPKPTRPPLPAVEMYVQLHASSREALDHGEWRGVIAPATLAYGGRTFCRFFDIVDPAGLPQLKEYARREEAFFPDTLLAELSYLPKRGRGANVAIRPLLRTYEIVVNTTPSVPLERVIALSDLVVGVEHEGFYLRSLSHGKRVVVTQSHMLNSQRAPNVCRFLLEISQDAYPLLSSFNWGPVANVPFLPRVVRKKMVLRPAKWNLQTIMVEPTGSGSAQTRFFAGLQKWRKQWQVPRYVYLQEHDNRLLLDLEHPLSVAELHHSLQKAGQNAFVRLQEMLPDFDHLWLHDKQGRAYLTELVVPLIATKPNTPQQSTETMQAERPQHFPVYPITERERLKLAGDDWTFLKLYAPIKQHDELITMPLRKFVQQLSQQQLIDRWFFVRYADPEPHLRIRFHAANAQTSNELLVQALAWGRSLVTAGLAGNLVLDTYRREIERYGGPQAIDLLEEAFMVNSVATAEIIAALYTNQITLDEQVINVFMLDQLFTLWGLDLSQRLSYLQKRTGKYEQSEAFRPQRRLFCELLQPWDASFDPKIQSQRTLLLQANLIQETVLQRVSAALHDLTSQNKLWVPEETILASLAHMQFNRLYGIDRTREQAGYALWRHTLESIQRRPSQKHSQSPKL
ncbi:lantibiotic dehydratase [Ktedonosporobacter rubrisoli]|nr:lantibiotic dehydratase [Ktedonosporobacter rubrisoli]